MKLKKLENMLNATREDLIDGFPCKAVIGALSLTGESGAKLEYLNKALAYKNITVAMADQEPAMMDGFKEAGLAGAVTYVNGAIEVKLTDDFFIKDSNQSILKRALRFQSLVTHELVHREQFQSKHVYGKTVRTDEEFSNTEYLNDLQEIEAMAAEISHDMRAKHLLGGAQVFDISPRLKSLMDNARFLAVDTLDSLNLKMRAYA